MKQCNGSGATDCKSELEESRVVDSKSKQCSDSERKDNTSELEESRAVDSKLSSAVIPKERIVSQN